MAPVTPDRIAAGQSLFETGAAWKALTGFFLSGLLFSFLGVILPVWGHHLVEDYVRAGNYFLAMNLGILAALGAARALGRGRLAAVLALACALACAALLYLAFLPPATPAWQQFAGIFVLGCGAGLLNIGVFRAISPLYRHNPAATINLAGAMFGAGCVLMAVLVAGTYYVYTVTSILILLALLPGMFIPIYARARFAPEESGPHPSFRQAFSDFRSPAAVLFALLLFFQFGNEWSIAGWLPLFLIQRLGISPESSLMMLATYWLALLVGRVAVIAVLPSISRGKLLMGSVVAALFGCTILISTDNRFGAVVGILLVGGGFASVYPLVVEKIGGRFPYYHPGFFNGIFSFALTGGMLAPWSLGFFTSLWGIRVAMALPLLGTLMVFLLLVLIWAEAKFGGTLARSAAQKS
jgi:MFS transporter, FHS family, glucose/mannose:H+ symporter